MLEIWIIIIGVIFLFWVIRKFAISAGDAGEHAVARKLRWLPKNEYFVINDLLIEKNNGNTTQIDHVVVSPYGIFVIETKNIYGYIHGSDRSALWRSCWRNRDLVFDNPILQNESHIKALLEKLQKYNTPFISIIAFSPNAELQVSVNDTYVIYWGQVRKLIRKHKERRITLEEAQSIYNYLLSLNIKDKQIRKMHATHAQNNKRDYEQRKITAIENGRCPRCGGWLIKRHGTYGPFYGCSNYPSCTYTHPAE